MNWFTYDNNDEFIHFLLILMNLELTYTNIPRHIKIKLNSLSIFDTANLSQFERGALTNG